MKKDLLILLLLNISVSLFALNRIEKAMSFFDTALEKENKKNAEIVIGFITYTETDSCGSIVPYLQNQIKDAAINTKNIKIVDSLDLNESQQSLVATRGLYKVEENEKKAASSGKGKNKNQYILNGRYGEKGKDVEVRLEIFETTGKLFSSTSVVIPGTEIAEKGLTLYPKNRELVQTISQDYKGTLNTDTNSRKINLAASMTDSHGQMVNMLYPNDIVKFKVRSDKDCYIAILCIDANGVKQWLPVNNSFLEAGTTRFFPDLNGQILRIADDGVFGAEQVIIYAATEIEGLPPKSTESKYSSQDLQMIMRNQRYARENTSFSAGSFKITYTIISK